VAEARAGELAALAVRKYLDALCVYFWAATPLLQARARGPPPGAQRRWATRLPRHALPRRNGPETGQRPRARCRQRGGLPARQVHCARGRGTQASTLAAWSVTTCALRTAL